MEEACDVVILSAGSSSRLGKPKQTLPYKETNLLQHAIEIALASMAQRVVVVLGANAERLQPPISSPRLVFIINQQWQEGIAASVRQGLQYLLKQAPPVQNVLFMVVDQPFISAGLLDKLITLQSASGSEIVASQYAETAGTPVVFSKTLFPELLQLKGDAGAKKLITKHPEKVVTVPFPLGEIDIDTQADYDKLQKM